ncbi:MAG: hypothetical protein II707_10450, partial [Spirochaetales bacterium]|nr:hypothetical protein [Spirochaetales bacterium]
MRRISKHFQALKDYIGEREMPQLQYEFDEIELHRCHFRITQKDKQFIFETAAKMKWSANHLCSLMIEKSLPLVETALFKSKDEYDYDVIIQPEPTNVPRMPVYLEHRYEVGEYKENMFVVLTRETFLMLQYLKESLHFYSYCELFRLIVRYFNKNLDLSDLEMPKKDEDGNDMSSKIISKNDAIKAGHDNNEGSKEGNEENIEEARERLRGVLGMIKERLEKFRATRILIGTIVPINIRRIRATADCLYPPTQTFLEKMVI